MKTTAFCAAVLATVSGIGLSPTVLAADGNRSSPPEPANPFYALCVSTHDARYRTPADQAKLLGELGYDGMAHVWLGGVDKALQAADANDLALFALYAKVSIAPNAPKYDPRLQQVIRSLKGRRTVLGLLIVGGKPSDPTGDRRAVEIVREIAGMAAESGLTVALYPHTGHWLERVEDAMRLCEKVDRDNVGITFNLCHYLKVEDEKNMASVLKSAAPHLAAVTINGADRDCKGGTWNRLIQPLDRGTFDTYRLLKTLKRLGYTGPIGLQCYGVKGDVRENLRRSIALWREMSARIAAEE